MKIILLLACIAFAGCGAKSNEEKAKELVQETLKAKLPDFNSYESISYGPLGNASQSFEETDGYKAAVEAVHTYQDSLATADKLLKENAATYGKEKLQLWQDSIKAINERKSVAKQAYLPEKLYKMKHAYKFKSKPGVETTNEEEYYFDQEVTKVVKVRKLN